MPTKSEKSDAEAMRLNQMFLKQLDSMGSLSRNKQDTSQKSEGKVSKPSLNELKLKSQAEQMKKTTTSNNSSSGKTVSSNETTATTSTSSNSNNTPQTQKRRQPFSVNQMSEQTFHQSLSGLNLSLILHNHEMKEKRPKSKTFCSDNATGTSSAAYSHYHTISSGEQFCHPYSSGSTLSEQDSNGTSSLPDGLRSSSDTPSLHSISLQNTFDSTNATSQETTSTSVQNGGETVTSSNSPPQASVAVASSSQGQSS